ncbi:MAG: hypothetical protein A2469_02670 [Candidatus Magasanikbacteria bacterium RIFOXYC2_FULL_40_16]|uniref:Uncharacterized protein n=1 Tax=Candidatus Magasanikbacteria bacterium RIFOXYC2_FULL_40_16 TaxID=1798703 RepID=A0A1F6NZC4_9BACT|nr:MAG: hypothetical protein A2301_01755 [Candidatus Magasanikbacteria bacterium RIFOXYB2_FULL_40_13]OGH89180.1 MAG: hypothetical protein A2469_02670 [Candidatus Magasanikbacteria bacterium RIFOXYC2_FULL_40_16]
MGYKPGVGAKLKNHLLSNGLNEPRVEMWPKKTLADVDLSKRVSDGKFSLVINFLNPQGNVFHRGELASFSERADAREAMREVIVINGRYRPEIVINK